MCRAMEEMRKDERIECALEMLADGMKKKKVAKYSKLSIEEVREYLEEAGADVDGMSDEELEDASEVFALPDGKYLIVEG